MNIMQLKRVFLAVVMFFAAAESQLGAVLSAEQKALFLNISDNHGRPLLRQLDEGGGETDADKIRHLLTFKFGQEGTPILDTKHVVVLNEYRIVESGNISDQDATRALRAFREWEQDQVVAALLGKFAAEARVADLEFCLAALRPITVADVLAWYNSYKESSVLVVATPAGKAALRAALEEDIKKFKLQIADEVTEYQKFVMISEYVRQCEVLLGELGTLEVSGEAEPAEGDEECEAAEGDAVADEEPGVLATSVDKCLNNLWAYTDKYVNFVFSNSAEFTEYLNARQSQDSSAEEKILSDDVGHIFGSDAIERFSRKFLETLEARKSGKNGQETAEIEALIQNFRGSPLFVDYQMRVAQEVKMQKLQTEVQQAQDVVAKLQNQQQREAEGQVVAAQKVMALAGFAAKHDLENSVFFAAVQQGATEADRQALVDKLTCPDEKDEAAVKKVLGQLHAVSQFGIPVEDKIGEIRTNVINHLTAGIQEEYNVWYYQHAGKIMLGGAVLSGLSTLFVYLAYKKTNVLDFGTFIGDKKLIIEGFNKLFKGSVYVTSIAGVLGLIAICVGGASWLIVGNQKAGKLAALPGHWGNLVDEAVGINTFKTAAA